MNRTPDHEYAPGSIEGMIATVAAMYPGEPIIRVDDPLGTDVRLLRSVAMSDEEREAVLAGDAVTLENGARVERAQPNTVATDRGTPAGRAALRGGS